MTNSPPVNVHEKDNTPSLTPYTILSSGIDTLHLNYYLSWESMNFLDKLKEYRDEAKTTQQSVSIRMQTNIPEEAGVFMVKPHGSSGYAYLLTSDEYALKFMHPGDDSGETLTRPPLNAEFRSLLLHTMGSKAAENRLQNLLSSAGAVIHDVHVSRVDVHCDILLPESEWGEFIKQQIVTRAKDIARYDSGELFSGFSIGRGVISARFYDKPLEVIKSGKSWMYDVWKLPVGCVPEGMRIIRVEFQLRREKVKELGITTFTDLKAYASRLWAYCTQEWLKVMDNPGKHTARRKILPWWEAVQKGFLGLPAGKPLIAARKVSADKKRAYRNMLGYMSSYFAADHLIKPLSEQRAEEIVRVLKPFIPEIEDDGFSGANLLRLVLDKCSRYNRSAEKYSHAMEVREEKDSFTDDYQQIEDIPF